MIKIPYDKNTYRCWDDLKRRWVKCPDAPVGGAGAWGGEEKPVIPSPTCSNFVENPANNELTSSTMINITANLNTGLTYNISNDFAFQPFRFFLSECCENTTPAISTSYNGAHVSTVAVTFPGGIPLTQGYNVFNVQVTFLPVPGSGRITIRFEIPGCQEQVFEILYTTTV